MSEEEPNTSKKKKERVVVIPSCPASVSTAYLLVRAAVTSVAGCNILTDSSVVVSPMQPTYIKDNPILSGKFSISLGKKRGTSCDLDLPENRKDAEALFAAIENVANRLLSSSSSSSEDNNIPIISCYRMTKEQIVNQYGCGVLDGGHSNDKKCPPNKLLTVAYLKGWMLAVPPSVPYNNNNNNNNNTNKGAAGGGNSVMERIVLDLPQCHVTAGKKARRTEIGIKFRVVMKEDEEANADPDADAQQLAVIQEGSAVDDVEGLKLLSQAVVRCEEGRTLQKEQSQREQEEKEAAAATLVGAGTSAASTAAAVTSAAAGGGAGGDSQNTAASSSAPTAKGGSGGGDDENNNNTEEEEEMVVNAFEVKGKIDYNKLVDQFGSQLIQPSLMATLEQLTVGSGRVPKLHRFLRRGMFFSHRDLDTLLQHLLLQANDNSNTNNSKNDKMYLYTGRGPSSESMHLGHLVPFYFTQWLQKAFGCPLVIQMTDDEKFIHKGRYDDERGDYNLDDYRRLTMENARDIIACGFDYERTFLFSDCEYLGRMYPNVCRIWKATTVNTVNGIFGWDGSSNCGKVAFPAIQAAPAFATSFPDVLEAKDRANDKCMCLIPCAIDQDPYFRMTRDIAGKMASKKHPLKGKPAIIHSKFFPALQGAVGKMSSSDSNSAIFLTDSPADIERKIKEHAFSGGQDTKAEQQKKGANLEVDVAFQWLRFFLEDDDELAAIGADYGSGSGTYWSTSAVKNKLIAVLQDVVAEHQKRRALITDEEVYKWMAERSIV